MEQVLVVKREALETRLTEEDFISEGITELIEFMLSNYHFAPREQAEYDRSIQQIIPYVVIRQNDRYFLLRRLNKQTETRLHDRLSLGIGGHINPMEQEIDGVSVIEAGMKRELEEEVFVESIANIQCVGILNDRSGGVSDFHLGIVYLLEAKGEVSVRETEKMEGTWATRSEIETAYPKLETWSQILVDQLLRIR